MRYLYPDSRLQQEPDLERRIAGPEAEVIIRHGQRPEDLDDALWASADALLLHSRIPVTAALLEKTPRCRIVVRIGVGFDTIDLAACGARGIPVCNTPDYGTTDVADMAMAMLLSLARGVAVFDRVLRSDPVGNWRPEMPPTMLRLRGRRLGIVGLGRIGTAVALRAQAFGLQIAFFDPELPSGAELAFGFERMDTLHGLLHAVDAVSIHAPLNDRTRHLIDARAVAAMKPAMLLINTARGPICDLRALEDGLRRGIIAGAALDVLPVEPADPEDPLIRAWMTGEDWIRDRLLVAPHAAFYSPEAHEDLRRLSMETAVMYLRQGRLRNCVNEAFLRR